jgi:hypothetical protein
MEYKQAEISDTIDMFGIKQRILQEVGFFVTCGFRCASDSAACLIVM